MYESFKILANMPYIIGKLFKEVGKNRQLLLTGINIFIYSCFESLCPIF